MRKGQNPARMGLPAYSPRQVGLGVLVYIPDLQGYYADSLEIVRTQLISLRQTIGDSVDLLVFDNGSNAEVQTALETWFTQGWFDWLLLSKHNLGKTGALNWILAALPNSIVGYCDSDVLFRPGWLEASLELMESFPKAGLITAQPCFFDILRGSGKTIPPAECIQIQSADVAAWQEYQRGLGKTVVSTESIPQWTIIRAENGREAVLGASHMQFLMPRSLAQAILPLPVSHGLDPAEDRILNQRVDDAGWFHLSTCQPLVYHMGNSLDDPVLQQELQARGLHKPENIRPVRQVERRRHPFKKFLASLLRWPVAKRNLRRLYFALFELFSEHAS